MSALGRIPADQIMQGKPAIIDWDRTVAVKTTSHMISDVATAAMKPGIKIAVNAAMNKAGCKAPDATIDLTVDYITPKINDGCKKLGDKSIDGACVAISAVSQRFINHK